MSASQEIRTEAVSSERLAPRWPVGPTPRRAALAVLVAVVLGGLAVTVVVDVVAVQLVGHSLIWPYRSLAHDLRTTTWSYGWARFAAAVAIAVGLVLIVAAVLPGRSDVALVDHSAYRVVVTPRHSLRRALARTAGSVPGVERARVRLGRSVARVEVQTSLRDPRELPAVVADALEQRLAVVAPVRPVRVEVRVRQR